VNARTLAEIICSNRREKMRLRKIIKLSVILLIVLVMTACRNDDKHQLLQERIDELEKKVLELNFSIDEMSAFNIDLQDILLEKENQLRLFETSKDFDSSLSNSNVDGHFGPFHQSVWGESGHLYSGYIKTIFQRIFFKEDYYWIEGGKVEYNPIENLLLREEFNNNLLGLKFKNEINSKVTSLPDNISEVWLFSLDDESNSIFLLDINEIWYSYKVLDSNLKADFRVFRSILESYDEWIKDSIK
jgi:uncharacterized coiled-coil protein SlyX